MTVLYLPSYCLPEQIPKQASVAVGSQKKMSKATNDPWAPQSSIPRIHMPGELDPRKLNVSSEEYIATLGENTTIKTFKNVSDILSFFHYRGSFPQAHRI